MTLTQAKCNEISEKPVITSLLTEENAFVADNTHDSIIEDAEIVMEKYPTTNSTQDIPHENLKILATECGNATEDVISLNNDVYNTVFVSKNNVSFSNTEEILRDNTDESQLPEHFVQGNGNKDKNNEFEKTSKINILQNIIIQNNDDGPHYKEDEVDANNLQHKEDCSEAEDLCYLPEESSDTNELEGEQEEETFLTVTPGVLYFKTDFNEENFEQVDFNRATKRLTCKEKRAVNSNEVVPNSNLMLLKPIRETLKPISTKKYNDLQNLLTWVPKRFHEYFKNLPHGNLKEDD
ncbi:hypothetical protein FQA39_LY09900 [Lamprigera yunnana]|nr:hypothetical protein FQA39_LY09900 [Lamprigera yunnana]